MADDKSKTGKADDLRIDVNDPGEVQYWSKKFEVDSNRLKEAVARVGVMAEKVERDYQSKFRANVKWLNLLRFWDDTATVRMGRSAFNCKTNAYSEDTRISSSWYTDK